MSKEDLKSLYEVLGIICLICEHMEKEDKDSISSLMEEIVSILKKYEE